MQAEVCTRKLREVSKLHSQPIWRKRKLAKSWLKFLVLTVLHMSKDCSSPRQTSDTTGRRRILPQPVKTCDTGIRMVKTITRITSGHKETTSLGPICIQYVHMYNLVVYVRQHHQDPEIISPRTF